MYRLAVALAALGLSACASMMPSPTPTGPKVGYSEEMISANRYRVTYTAPASTKPQDVANRALAHAAQLTLNKGNEWFEIAGKIDGDHTQTLVIVMGSGETLAGGTTKTYDAKEILNGLKSKIG